MKTYKAILNEIKKNFDRIGELNKMIRKEKDAEKVADLCREREPLAIINQILRDNYTHSLAVAGKKALAEVTAKYDGKPYGEMTQKAIAREMKKRGFYVYFNRYGYNSKACSSATISAVDYPYTNDNGTIYAPRTTASHTNDNEYLLTADNKIITRQ